jgi:2-phosphoglycerate kinase
MPVRRLPEGLESIGRQILVGVGRIAHRAIANGARSVIDDVDRVGETIRKRADRAKRRIDEILADEHRR